MFTYNGEVAMDLGLSTKFDELALNSHLEEELFELLKIKHPLLNRLIARNINLTENVMQEMLTNHVAYTMCINLAKNKNITPKIKTMLYYVSQTQYKESKLKEDLDRIFLKN